MRKTGIATALMSFGLVASFLPLSPLSPTSASAHSWYEPDCCGGQDCERIAVERITFLDDGNMRMRDAKGTDWLINVRELRSRIWGVGPGGTREEAALYEAWMASRGADEIPPGAIKRASQDGDYHLCVYRGQVQCVYFPADR